MASAAATIVPPDGWRPYPENIEVAHPIFNVRGNFLSRRRMRNKIDFAAWSPVGGLFGVS
jgi:hypothetical protein